MVEFSLFSDKPYALSAVALTDCKVLRLSKIDFIKIIKGRFQVNLKRQQMANLSGMRVETTIRTIKALERKRIVKIINHKIFY